MLSHQWMPRGNTFRRGIPNIVRLLPTAVYDVGIQCRVRMCCCSDAAGLHQPEHTFVFIFWWCIQCKLCHCSLDGCRNMLQDLYQMMQTDVVLKLPDSRHSETLHFHICLSICLTFHTRSMSASQTELYICISVCTENVIVHRSRLW